MKREKKTKYWIPVKHKLPPIKEKVRLKRDFSVGVSGDFGQFEWESIGSYTYYNDRLVWRVKRADGLTIGNSTPTHWKLI